MYKEFHLREIPLPPEYRERKRALLRWMVETLSLQRRGEGLALDVLDAVFHYNIGKGYAPTFEEIRAYVEKRRLERGKGRVSDEAIRYYLRRMEAMRLLEREKARGGGYRLARGPYGGSFVEAMRAGIEDVLKLLEHAYDALRTLYL